MGNSYLVRRVSDDPDQNAVLYEAGGTSDNGDAPAAVVYYSETDPGPVGAGAIWVKFNASENTQEFYIRDNDNSTWATPSFVRVGSDDTVRLQVEDNALRVNVRANGAAAPQISASDFVVDSDATSVDVFGADGFRQSQVSIRSNIQIKKYAAEEASSIELHLTGDPPQLVLVGLPTANPNVAGALWIDTAAGRVLKVSAG